MFAKHLADANVSLPSSKSRFENGELSDNPVENGEFTLAEMRPMATAGINGISVSTVGETLDGKALPQIGKELPLGDSDLPPIDKGLLDEALLQSDRGPSQDNKILLQAERAPGEGTAPTTTGVADFMSERNMSSAAQPTQESTTAGAKTVDRMAAPEISQRVLESQPTKLALDPAPQLKQFANQSQGPAQPSGPAQQAPSVTSPTHLSPLNTVTQPTAGQVNSQPPVDLGLAPSTLPSKTVEGMAQVQSANNGTVEGANPKSTDTSSKLSGTAVTMPSIGKTGVTTTTGIPGAVSMIPATTLEPASAAEVALAMHTTPGSKVLSQAQKKSAPAQTAQLGVQDPIDDSARSSLASRRDTQGGRTNVNVQRYDALAGATGSNSRMLVEDQALQIKSTDLGTTSVDGKSVVDAVDRTLATHQRVLSAVPDTARTWTQSLTEASTRELGSAVHDQVMRSMSRQALAQGRLTIQLNPRELGALDIEFSTERGELQVAIVARESMTRELLDGGLVRLRQSLQEAGINVGDLDVRQESKQDQQQTDSRKRSPSSSFGTAQAPDVEAESRVIARPNGLFDIYV